MSTKDEILNEMLASVPNTYDKREGSVIFDSCAPSARQFYIVNELIKEFLNNTFAGTADREWLIKKGAEIGIKPHDSTYAIRKGLFTPVELNIAVGERFSYEDLNFIVIEKLEDGVYALQCEQKGSKGNLGSGTLLPINYVNGLETATLSGEILIYGEDEEDTETFRARYFATLPTMTLDGNVAQYTKWLNEFDGVGRFKIISCWNGRNTVKVSILSAENTQANPVLIEEVQTYLDPPKEEINDDLESENYPQGRGLGMGQAPIGAIVTVSTAEVLDINLDAVLILKDGYTHPVGLQESIEDYLKSLNYNRSNVSYISLGAIFDNNQSIESVLDLKLNGEKTDVPIPDETIVELKTLNIEVV